MGERVGRRRDAREVCVRVGGSYGYGGGVAMARMAMAKVIKGMAEAGCGE